MVAHYRSLDELIAAAPDTGRLGGADATSGMKLHAYVEVLGETWRVNWETHIEDLIRLRDYIANGGDPIRITRGGRRALGIGTDAEGVYIYEMEREHRDPSYRSSAATPHGLCCFVTAPIGSECACCGATVESAS